MTISKTIPFLAICCFFINSCSPSLSTFSEKLYEDGDWSEKELKDIQFYTSDNIVLQRQIKSGQSKIVDGEIKIVNGRKVEEIIIRKGTPGVFVKKTNEKDMAISFESGKDKFLIFGPNKKIGGRYAVKANDWKRNKGKVNYSGKIFTITVVNDVPMLQVDLSNRTNTTRKSRVAKGRKVN